MGKPLTTDELKALKVGDWVWIRCPIIGTYVMKTTQSDERLEYRSLIKESSLDYADYEKHWVAYKNKEEEVNDNE